MLEELKEEVYLANMELPKKKLITYTWGNVSGIDRKLGLVVIKPSGVSYENMKVEDMVVVNLQGDVIEGKYKPSSDTATHLALYNAYDFIGGIVHTHSTWATTFAQAGLDIQAFGTTHGDYFYGSVPCTRPMTKKEIQGEYEKETGNVIIETFKTLNKKAEDIPAVLVHEHGPFTWGQDSKEAVYHAVVLEEVAKMAYGTMVLKNIGSKEAMKQELLDKHFLRKHGANAYYGQN